jgi:DNA-directed RNA polymerase specialized sigma24 family protein
MTSDQPVTQLIHQLLERNQDPVPKIWEIYFPRLVELARKKLCHTPTQAADGEDVALSAFASFCRCAAEGRFPRLADRHDLWQLLVLITVRKVSNLKKREARRRPRLGRLLHASALAYDQWEQAASIFANIIGREPAPTFEVEAAAECSRLLAGLDDELLCKIALLKMEGYTNQEIAARIKRSKATVERKLARIRAAWEEEIRR